MGDLPNDGGVWLVEGGVWLVEEGVWLVEEGVWLVEEGVDIAGEGWACGSAIESGSEESDVSFKSWYWGVRLIMTGYLSSKRYDLLSIKVQGIWYS